jgi:thiol-disulfide isomerase/thioredoxin
VDGMLKKIDDGSMQSNGFCTKAQATFNAHKELNQRLSIHIGILAGLKRNEEALSYFKYITDDDKLNMPELNDIHVEILENMHTEKNKVRSLIESCVAKNAVSPILYEKLKALYLEDHPDLSNFEQYLSSLKSNDVKEKIKLTVAKNLMNVDFQPFELDDLKGNTVRSANWKDKIVVLDFWATWCKPCINALPGMQILVDKYANDPQVDFYFIGTMQTGDYKTKTQDFVRKEGFRLKFLYDGINPKTGNQDAVFSKFAPVFESSGIPRKVVVKNGIIRYTNEGYGGSASELADEISYVIELLKAEDNK